MSVSKKDIRGSTRQSGRSAAASQEVMTTYEHVPAIRLLAGSRLMAGGDRGEVEGRRLEGSLGRHFGRDSGGERRVRSPKGHNSRAYCVDVAVFSGSGGCSAGPCRLGNSASRINTHSEPTRKIMEPQLDTWAGAYLRWHRRRPSHMTWSPPSARDRDTIEAAYWLPTLGFQSWLKLGRWLKYSVWERWLRNRVEGSAYAGVVYRPGAVA